MSNASEAVALYLEGLQEDGKSFVSGPVPLEYASGRRLSEKMERALLRER